MKYSKALFAATACAWITLYGASALAAAQVFDGNQDEPKTNYGDIIFFNSKGEKICSLSVPETKKTFDFSESSQSCENNKVASFTLQGIPSATLIYFHENQTCSDGKYNNNFFVKLKTVKQPTSWVTPPNPPMPVMNFNDFKKKKAGDLIPDRNIRVDDQWEGSEFANKDWDERISCVYIERSQPVK
ncbi:hypothetical protein [Pseudomonas sp. Sample_22]|uniref:hypothetical protein n=1 Tax=Pseudomonas sp. Sample_22 TaxID=2448266 RepID=UPI001032D57A|nr:hypothetical protein [Pseudomonas sp. Sample_22]